LVAGGWRGERPDGEANQAGEQNRGDQGAAERSGQGPGDRHLIWTSKVKVSGSPSRTAVTSKVQVPAVGNETPAATMWSGLIGTTGSLRGGTSGRVASIWTASNPSGAPLRSEKNRWMSLVPARPGTTLPDAVASPTVADSSTGPDMVARAGASCTRAAVTASTAVASTISMRSGRVSGRVVRATIGTSRDRLTHPSATAPPNRATFASRSCPKLDIGT